MDQKTVVQSRPTQLGRGSSAIVTKNSDAVRKTAISQRQNKLIQRQIQKYQQLSTIPEVAQTIPRFRGRGRQTDGRQFFQMETFPEGSKDLFSIISEDVHPRMESIREQITGISRIVQQQRRFLVSIGDEILRMIYRLHRHNIAHGDIKPENIVIIPNPNNPSRATVRVIDLGFTLSGDEHTDSLRGSPDYVPPQLIQKASRAHRSGQQIRITVDDTQNYDRWATGIILVDLLIYIVDCDIILHLLHQHPNEKLKELQQRLYRIAPLLKKYNEKHRIPPQTLQNLNNILQRYFQKYEFNLFHRNDPVNRYIREKHQKKQSGASTQKTAPLKSG